MIGKIDEILIPRIDQIFETVLGKGFLYLCGLAGSVMIRILDDFLEGLGLDIGEVNLLLATSVLDHVFEELGFFGHLLVHLEFSLVRCNQSYLGHS